MSTKNKEATLPQKNQDNIGINDNLGNVNANVNEAPGYVKQIFTEQDVYTSGVVYRYVNNIDPNKDLITDTALIDGPIQIVTVKDK